MARMRGVLVSFVCVGVAIGCSDGSGSSPPPEDDASTQGDVATVDTSVDATCAEPDADFCTRNMAACGEVTGMDTCGVSRTVQCGNCTAPMECNSSHQCATVMRWQHAGGGDSFFSYQGVWGQGASTYALLGDGTIERIGPTVNDHRSVTRLPPGGNGMWGLGSAFYAFGDGYVYRFEGGMGARVGNISGEVKALWGSGPNDLWAAMLVGGLRHWDGRAWDYSDRTDLPPDANTDIRGLFGFGPSDVWAVGTHAAIFHWGGTRWERASSPVSGVTFLGVWGGASNDVWAVGGEFGLGGAHTVGNVLRNRGDRWTDTLTGIALVQAIHGLAADDIWAVGSAGLILHWNGSRWVNYSIGGSDDLYAVWARSPTDVWAVGDGGLIAHYGL